MEFITIRTFDNSIEARLFSSKLESMGITCFLENESTMTLDPLLNYAIGGIQVTVEKHNYDLAKRLAEEYSQHPIVDQDGKTTACPKCKSSQIDNGYSKIDDAKSVFGIILGLMFFVVPFLDRNKYRCTQCNHIFK